MKCLVCDNTMKQTKDWLHTCPSCGFYMSDLSSGTGRAVDGLESLRRKNFEILLNQVENHKSWRGKEVLEIGCADGWFLDVATKRGAKCLGIEPSDICKVAQAAGHNVLQGFFPDVLDTRKKFDFIVFNDVFEHLPDPISILKDCESFLNNEGCLVINLPNSDGVFFKVSKIFSFFNINTIENRLWQKGLASPHLTYFNKSNLLKFVSRYSDFSYIDDFPLKTMSKNGLLDRINTTHKGVKGRMIYAAIISMLPILEILPKDTITVVFRKTATS